MAARKGTDPRRTIAYFDEIAHGYQALYDQTTPTGYAFTVRRQRVLELLDVRCGDVLDVGCGPGVMAAAVEERGCRFWGVDPSIQMIEAARAAASSVPGTHFAVGAAEQLALSDARFDAVICMGVIERLADDGLALAEMTRVLKPGGTLIVTMPNRFSPALQWRDQVFYRVVALLRPVHRWLTGAGEEEPVRAYRSYDRRRFAAAIDRHGCEVVDVVYCVYGVLPAPLDSLLPRLATRWMKLAEILHRSPLAPLGGAIVVKAKKRGDGNG